MGLMTHPTLGSRVAGTVMDPADCVMNPCSPPCATA